MKIYVSADMEGIAGIVSREQLIPGERLYDEGRALLTDEVNAVVDVLAELGVERIIVKDAHFAGLNLLPHKLHPAAEYAFGALRADQRFPGLDGTFDGAFLIGYHAMGGTLHAIRDHTMAALPWQQLALNGRQLGEIGLDALLFGLHGVPVLLVSGDDKTCAEASTELGAVTTYQTKQAHGRHAGLLRAPRAVHAGYKQVVRRALQQRHSAQPHRLDGPYDLAIRFASTDLLDARVFDGERDRRVDGLNAVYTDTSLTRLFSRAL